MSDEKFERNTTAPSDEWTLDLSHEEGWENLEKGLEHLELAPVPDTTDEWGLSHDASMRDMQETFLSMARNTLNPLARYMKALHSGEDAREVYEISEFVITPLISKVEQVGLISHAEDLTFFRSLVLLAMGESDPEAKEKLKNVVIEGFNDVKKRFNLYCRGYRKAVRNLIELYRALKKADSMPEQDIRRLFAIGIPSLSWFKKMKVAEIANLSGVSPSQIQKVRDIAGHGVRAMGFAAAELSKEDFFPKSESRSEDVSGAIPEIETAFSLSRKIL